MQKNCQGWKGRKELLNPTHLKIKKQKGRQDFFLLKEKKKKKIYEREGTVSSHIRPYRQYILWDCLKAASYTTRGNFGSLGFSRGTCSCLLLKPSQWFLVQNASSQNGWVVSLRPLWLWHQCTLYTLLFKALTNLSNVVSPFLIPCETSMRYLWSPLFQVKLKARQTWCFFTAWNSSINFGVHGHSLSWTKSGWTFSFSDKWTLNSMLTLH